jgi:hypothetical protein
MLVMVLKTSRHLEPDEIERYSNGGISEEILAPLEEHLLICETCQAHVCETDKFVGGMESAARNLRQTQAGPDRKSHSIHWLPIVALATTFAGALLAACSRFSAPAKPRR